MSSHFSDADLAQRAKARQRLNRDWLIAAALAIISLFLGAKLLLTQWRQEPLGRWAILTGLAIFYQLRIFKQVLPLMHLPGTKTLRMGIDLPVRLVWLSGLGYALLAGFLMVTQPENALGWLPAGLAALALIAAVLAEAQARGHKSLPVGGQHMLLEFRALGTLVLTALAIHYARLESWLLIIGLMPYLHLFSISWLGRKQKILHPPPAQPQQFLQTLYLAALSISLWPVAPHAFSVLLSFLFGLPYFLVSLRDWFILTGLLDPKQSQYQQVVDALTAALTGWLALSFRLLGAMASATVAADILLHRSDYNVFALSAMPLVLVGVLLVSTLLLLMAVWPRAAALLAFIALTIISWVMGGRMVIFAGLAFLGATMMLGPGHLRRE
jgi:hypothetical protein